ncbi:hypothetical protein N9163_01620 [bacterium]|nr:hypothetical protein [Akkermansiaceae bacterium]MDB4437528.1 hypothetical protein [bacterium]
MKKPQTQSSEMTCFYKSVFPVIWCGFLITIIVSTSISSIQKGELPPSYLLVLILMLFLGYFVFKTLAFDLVDELLEEGYELIVIYKGKQTRIPLRQISHVGEPSYSNPRRITLTLREPSALGSKISFCPTSQLFEGSSVHSHLIHRINDAQIQHRTSKEINS